MSTPMPAPITTVSFGPFPPPDPRYLRYNRILIRARQNKTSLEQLSRLLGHKVPSQLRRWASGEVLPSWPKLEILARALNTTPADLYPEYVGLIQAILRQRICAIHGEEIPFDRSRFFPPVILAIRPASRDQQWALFVGDDLRGYGYRRLGTGRTPIGEERHTDLVKALQSLLSRWVPDRLAIYQSDREYRTDLVEETIRMIETFAAGRGVPCKRMAEVAARCTVVGPGATDRRSLGKLLLAKFPFLAHELPLPDLDPRLPGKRLLPLTDHQKGLIDALVAGWAGAKEVEVVREESQLSLGQKERVAAPVNPS